MKQHLRPTYTCLALLIAMLLAVSCGEEATEPAPPGMEGRQPTAEQDEVVVYTALDRGFSEPILDTFEERSGVDVLAKYDTESTKTIGLVNTIRAEAERPRCDVFWNNEILNTMRLKREGLLQACVPPNAEAYPAQFRDPDGMWYGFAARARVLIVNTDLVNPDNRPDSIHNLADPRWRGKTGIAKPLFGTTATHAAVLFTTLGDEEAKTFFESLKKNDVRVESGNKTVALKVSDGQLAFGLTDTDDAIIEVEAGKPVTIVYPDSRDDQMGTLFIPNTLALIKNAPHTPAGADLINYLLAPEVETALAKASSAQIPLNPDVEVDPRVKGPSEVHAMEVDFEAAAARFEEVAKYIETDFLQ